MHPLEDVPEGVTLIYGDDNRLSIGRGVFLTKQVSIISTSPKVSLSPSRNVPCNLAPSSKSEPPMLTLSSPDRNSQVAGNVR